MVLQHFLVGFSCVCFPILLESLSFLSWTLKLYWTDNKEFSSLRHTLYGSIACSGLSTDSRIVAITRYCITRMRSAASRASLAKASVAFLRQSSNLFFALESASAADSSRSAMSNFLVRSATEHSLSPACVVDAPCSRLDLALSSTLYSSPIPSSKKLILASKSFFDNPSNLNLISSISRTITVADPDLELRGGGPVLIYLPCRRFSLQWFLLFLPKIRGARTPRAPPLDPPLDQSTEFFIC